MVIHLLGSVFFAFEAGFRPTAYTDGYRPGGLRDGCLDDPRGAVRAVRRRHAAARSSRASTARGTRTWRTSSPPGLTLALFDVVFRHTEGYDGLPDLAALKGFILAGAADGRCVRAQLRRDGQEVRKAQRVNAASTLRRRHVMFEDNEPWPIKCVSCAKEFEQPVRWLKGNNAVRCPLCKATNQYSNEEFLVALAEAKRGLFDPYGDMVRLYKGA